MTVSEPSLTPTPGPTPDGDRRLHPWSWLFVLLTRIRPFLLPALLFLFLRRGNSWELWGAVGALGFAVYSLIYSLGFRYRIARDELIVREGLISRTERHIPFARIQNIVQKRNVLHRWFGVTELRLESAGGSKPEAVMSVIRHDEAERLEAVLRGHVAPEAASIEGEATPATPRARGETLLTLDNAELLRLGLQSNRGMLLVGAAMAFVAQQQQTDKYMYSEMFKLARVAMSFIDHALAGVSSVALSAMLLIGTGMVLLKIASIVMTFVSYHGFRLSRDGERVATEQGLFTRTLASARRDKIQRLIVTESMFARWLGRRSLTCEIAAGRANGNEERSAKLSALVPIGTPTLVESVMRDVSPSLGLEGQAWRPLHPRAAGRVFKPIALVAFVLLLAFAKVTTWWALSLVPLVLLYLHRYAIGWARFARYAYDGRVLAFRAGWIRYQWTVVALGKGQNVIWNQSPFDRRRGMASVILDTAGAQNGFKMEIPYLPEAEARELFARLSRELSVETQSGNAGLSRGVAVA